MTLRAPLSQTVAGGSVPFGFTVSLWAAGAAATRAHGLPGVGEVLAFATGALIGVRLAQLWGGTVLVTGPPALAVRLRTHMPALVCAIAPGLALARLPWALAAWVATPAAAGVGYFVGLAAARACSPDNVKHGSVPPCNIVQRRRRRLTGRGHGDED